MATCRARHIQGVPAGNHWNRACTARDTLAPGRPGGRPGLQQAVPMAASGAAYGRLVDLIYSAVEHPARWPDVYEAIRAATGCESAHAGLRQAAPDPVVQRWRQPARRGRAGVHPPLPLDRPAVPMVAQPESPSGCTSRGLAPEVVASDPFYQDFLLPYDRRYNGHGTLVDVPEATVISSPCAARRRARVQPRAGLHRPGRCRTCAARRAAWACTTSSTPRRPWWATRWWTSCASPSADDARRRRDAHERGRAQLLRSTPRWCRWGDGEIALPPAHEARPAAALCGELEPILKSGQPLVAPR